MNAEILIIGGGPSGVEAALTASTYSKNIILVTKGNVGEWKAGYTNIFLNNIELIKKHHSFSISFFNKMYEKWEDHNTRLLKEAGVQIIYGEATFYHNALIKVKQLSGSEQFISSDKIFIANGSRPVFQKKVQPDGKRIFSYEYMMRMNWIPSSIIIIGDGQIGYEMVNIFNQLNVSVTWLLPEEPNLLIEEEIRRYMQEYYEDRGVKIAKGKWVKELQNTGDKVRAITEDNKTFEADAAFITLGFRSNVDQLQVEHLNLELNEYGSIDTNEFGQTANKSVYLIGDSLFPYSYAAVQAMAKARMTISHVFNSKNDPIDISNLPLAFNENPQIAHVGNIRLNDPNVFSKKIGYYTRNFRAFMSNEKEGYLRIVWNNDGIIIGGICIGSQAKEVISIIGLMVQLKVTVNIASSYFSTHPSALELPFHLFRRIEL